MCWKHALSLPLSLPPSLPPSPSPSLSLHTYIETFWSIISQLSSATDDQMCLNQALSRTKIKWRSKHTPVSEICESTKCWEGETPPAGNSSDVINVVILPQSVFCRGECCVAGMSLKHLYLVHPDAEKGAVLEKVDRLKGLQAWFIEQDNNTQLT